MALREPVPLRKEREERLVAQLRCRVDATVKEFRTVAEYKALVAKPLVVCDRCGKSEYVLWAEVAAWTRAHPSKCSGKPSDAIDAIGEGVGDGPA